MTDNLYDILGVVSSASQDEIRKAYRKLAAQFHPDRNPDPAAVDRFRDIQKAYEVIGKSERRELYDKHGDIALNPNFQGFEATPEERAREYNDFFSNFSGGSSHGTQSYQGSEGYDDYSSSGGSSSEGGWGFGGGFTGASGGFSAEDFYSSRTQSRNNRSNSRGSSDFGYGSGGFEPPQKGSDIRLVVNVSLLEAALGCQRVITVERATRWQRGSNAGIYKENVTIDIPQETETEHQIRVRGKGNPGQGGGSAGDLVVIVEVLPHPHLYRQGVDLYLQVPLTMQEAVLGTKIEVPTLQSSVRIQIPAGVRNGQKMRLRNRGIPKKTGGQGDLYLVLRPIPPEGSSEQLKDLAKQLEPFYPPGGVRNNFTLK